MRIRRFDKKKILLFLSVLGPGIITASVDNDAGGIATYSIAGAHFGYALLWTLLPITVALIVVQEMVARMGVVTGKTLADLIREKFGVRPTFFLLVALVLANLGNTVAEFAGWASAWEIFGVSKYFSVPVGAAAVWFLVVKGSYRVVEKIFLVACLIFFAYPVAAYLAGPDGAVVARNLVVPDIRVNAAYITLLIGMVGTTIAPWMQFYLQSAVVEKNLQVEEYPLTRVDVIFGCLVTDIVALSIIVACGATLYVAGDPHRGRQGRRRGAGTPRREDTPPSCSPSAWRTRRCSPRRSCRWPPPTASARGWGGSRGSTRTSARRRNSSGSTPALSSSEGRSSSTREPR